MTSKLIIATGLMTIALIAGCDKTDDATKAATTEAAPATQSAPVTESAPAAAPVVEAAPEAAPVAAPESK